MSTSRLTPPSLRASGEFRITQKQLREIDSTQFNLFRIFMDEYAREHPELMLKSYREIPTNDIVFKWQVNPRKLRE